MSDIVCKLVCVFYDNLLVERYLVRSCCVDDFCKNMYSREDVMFCIIKDMQLMKESVRFVQIFYWAFGWRAY